MWKFWGSVRPLHTYACAAVYLLLTIIRLINHSTGKGRNGHNYRLLSVKLYPANNASKSQRYDTRKK